VPRAGRSSGPGVEGARWGPVSVRRPRDLAAASATGRAAAAAATGRSARGLRALRTLRWRRIWDHHDVAVAYAAVVLVVAVIVAVEPAAAAHRVVQQSSTNLANLRSHPLMVLVVSAFVVSPAWGLVILVPLVAAYGALQAWLGRVSAVVIGVVGHVGATLFVATLEVTALTRNRVGFAVVRDADVGVSYGLATVVGLLAARVPVAWRRRYLAGSAVVMAVQLVLVQGFTALGHLVAWVVGLGLAVPVHRAAGSPGPAGSHDAAAGTTPRSER